MLRVAQSVCVLFCCGIFTVACSARKQKEPWRGILRSEVHRSGERNWIVIADSAFAVMAHQGIQTILTHEEAPKVLDAVLQEISESEHVTPKVFLTTELMKIDNDSAPGIERYRKEIKDALRGREETQLQERLIRLLLTETQQNFRVLVLKTETALPYSSVFIELDSGYWDSELEAKLRNRLDNDSSTP